MTWVSSQLSVTKLPLHLTRLKQRPDAGFWLHRLLLLNCCELTCSHLAVVLSAAVVIAASLLTEQLCH